MNVVSCFWILGATAFGAVPPPAAADSVIFSASRLEKRHGQYKSIEASHLFLQVTNGSRPKQITSGAEDDTDPVLSADHKLVLFWRTPASGLVGSMKLCSVRPDGTEFKILRRFVDYEPENPKAAAAALAGRYPFKVVEASGANGQEGYRILRRKSGQLIPQPLGLASPDGRYVAVDIFGSTELFDLAKGRAFPMPSVKSGRGGVDVPISIAWLGSRELVYGFYDQPSNLIGLCDARGKHDRKLHVYHVVKGKKTPANLIADNQWQENPHGARAFSLGAKEILLQEVMRSEDGGKPGIYVFNRSTGRIRFELAGQFLEDAYGYSFLTTKPLQKIESEGPLPQKLLLWDGQSVKSKSIGFPLMSCHGACLF